MELKFKDSSLLYLFVAIFCSGITLFLFVFGIIGANITGDSKHNVLALEIFGSILLLIWIIYFICAFLIYKTIIVTEEKITVTRRNKVLWSLNREDISECVYERLSVHNFYSSNVATMLFKLNETNKFAMRKLNKHFSKPYSISLSFNNVKKMEELGYIIRYIDSINEQ